MKVVVRGDRNQKSNYAGGQFPHFAFSLLFFLIGGLFFGLGIWLMISEEVFSSGDSDALFVSALSTILGGIAIGVGIYSFFKRPAISNTYDLMQSEHCVKMPIVSIEESNTRLNHVSGVYIVCRNINNEIGCLDEYRSDVIYNVHCAELQPGDLIPIYIDWRNPSCFYMDVDGFEKAGYADEQCNSINNTMI